MVAIETEQLSKHFRIPDKTPGVLGSLKQLVVPRYRSTVAVHDLDLRIEHGESVGFIGVNGAGKSTTVKMLTGILYPTGGTINVLGGHPYKQRDRRADRRGLRAALAALVRPAAGRFAGDDAAHLRRAARGLLRNAGAA